MEVARLIECLTYQIGTNDLIFCHDQAPICGRAEGDLTKTGHGQRIGKPENKRKEHDGYQCRTDE